MVDSLAYFRISVNTSRKSPLIFTAGSEKAPIALRGARSFSLISDLPDICPASCVPTTQASNIGLIKTDA
jgi:hypothetical protein